jgi:putative FmdB family regulatory protein
VPTYEYKCENGHHFEVVQRMSEDPLTACRECGAPVERVFHPVAVHFKGSGFYTTDYKKTKAATGGGSESKGESKSESGSGSSDSKKSESSSKAPAEG